MVAVRFNTNLPQFTQGLAVRAPRELSRDFAIAAEDTANDLNNDLANLAPVKSGRYLANIQATRRRRAYKELASWRGRDMLSANRAIIRRWARRLRVTRVDRVAPEQLFFSNLLRYATRIEDGWSGMAPSGVFRVAFGRLPAKIRAQPKR